MSLGAFRLGPLDLTLARGKALGFIGPNGAGKSSTIHAILGLLPRPDAAVEVLGRPAPVAAGAWKKDLGFVLSEQGFYERLTVADNLAFFASFYPDWDAALAAQIAKRLLLDPGKRARHLSTGERMKVALVAALSHRAKLLIMDEPTAGLDPIVRAELMDLLDEQLRAGELAVFLSTHILADAGALADDLAFLSAGKLVGVAGKKDLLARWRRIRFVAAAPPADLMGRIRLERDGSAITTTTDRPAEALAMLTRANARDVRVEEMTLEEISVTILQEAARP